MSSRRFVTPLVPWGSGTCLEIPFDPGETWGDRERYYVAGSIEGRLFRGRLEPDGSRWLLPVGPSWLRDNEIEVGATVEASLSLDGHQVDTLAPDIAEALRAEPEARAFFESVAPFYRNNAIRWIEGAKRPETRSKRIAETVRRLKAGERPR